MFKTVSALPGAFRGEFSIQDIFWSVQCRHPSLPALKDYVVPQLRRAFRRPHHQDFLALPLLTNAGLCIDVGANLGQSIDAFRIAFGRVPIVAFEPNPRLSRKISERFRRDRDVRVIAKGVSREEGDTTLFVPNYAGRPIHALGSILEAAAADWLKNAKLPGIDHGLTKCERILCQLTTIDALELSPKVMKIDVQGAELGVIQGAHDTILRSRPILMLESAKTNVRLELAKYSYRFYRYLGSNNFSEAAPDINDVIVVPEENDLLRSARSGGSSRSLP